MSNKDEIIALNKAISQEMEEIQLIKLKMIAFGLSYKVVDEFLCDYRMALSIIEECEDRLFELGEVPQRPSHVKWE